MAASSEFVKANEAYVAGFGDKGSLALPPAKKLIVVTCMDARLNPQAHLGLKEGEAHVIRNAGGVAADAIRSIVISQRLLGTREIAVIHHTGCGMLLFKTEQLRDIVKTAAPGDADVQRQVDELHFHEFSEVDGSVKQDVAWLKSHPLVLKESEITGWVYDVHTGKVNKVA